MSKTNPSLRWKIAQAAEWRWWKRYLKGKSVEEYHDWKTNYWRTFHADYLGDLPQGERLLDIGCGPAGIFTILSGNEVVAVDPLLARYEAELPHFAKANHPNVQFVNATLEDYTTDQTYDRIYCLNAINHVADWQAGLERLYSLLSAGGTLYLSTDVHRHRWLQPVFKALPGDVLHPHQHNLEEYLTALAQIGFAVERTDLVKRESIFDYQLIIGIK